MSLNLVSPGVKVREVDLTIGNITGANEQVGAIAGPFEQGPVGVPQLIESEQDLLKTFGQPGINTASTMASDYWLSASSYLSYGGVLRVVRADDADMKNATQGTAVKIKSYEDYNDNQANPTTWTVAARNPGSWANNMKVCAIDGRADQIISIGQTAVAGLVGVGVTQSLTGRKIAKADGTVADASGYLRGVITGIGATDKIEVKVTDIVTENTAGGGVFTSESVEYAEGSINEFRAGGIRLINTSGTDADVTDVDNGHTLASGDISDWYDEQTLGLTNSTVYWKSIAEKPSTSEFTSQRSGKNDEIHYVVVDDTGSVTGTSGNIIEKHLSLSKAKDGLISPSQNIYYRDYIANSSEYIFAGAQPASSLTAATGLTQSGTGKGWTLSDEGNWTTNAQGQIYAGIGATHYTLSGGLDYNGKENNFEVTLAGIIGGYDVFKNVAEYDVNFLIMGPSAANADETSAKARRLIAIAEERKDCIACISPHRSEVVNVANSDTQTENIVKFFDPLPSSSYAVFDSGYKYMYDRFKNEFKYVPLNADIAGLMARTSIDQFSWFSPAGAARGSINGAVKLAYNPSKAQRDQIYPKRINPVIASPGAGIILFGDKTGLGYASAFDRINVRRLFLTIESTIERAARDQLFEFNDIITRSSFLNVVDPYLRDVKAKRGITDYVVICDETNNTPDIIDSNQFRADIFVKPNRSINFIGLSFVATRTGVSFEEVVGNV